LKSVAPEGKIELTGQFYLVALSPGMPMTKRDRRIEILKAAEKLFSGRRFHEITLDDVVREAGVGKGTVYRYFRDKDDLFFQAAVNGSDELCSVLEEATSDEAPFAVQLRSACTQIGAFLRRRRSLFRMIQSEESRVHERKGEFFRQWRAHRGRLASAIEEILVRGANEGAIRRDMAPDVLGWLLLGMLRAHARGLGESLNEKQSVELVLNLFLQGAGMKAAEAASNTGCGVRE
jgi:AcrR family transcriptional regulator